MDVRDFLTVVDKLEELLLPLPPFSLALVSLGDWLLSTVDWVLSPELLLELFPEFFPPADGSLSSVTFTADSSLPFSLTSLVLDEDVGVALDEPLEVVAGVALVDVILDDVGATFFDADFEEAPRRPSSLWSDCCALTLSSRMWNSASGIRFGLCAFSLPAHLCIAKSE